MRCKSPALRVAPGAETEIYEKGEPSKMRKSLTKTVLMSAALLLTSSLTAWAQTTTPPTPCDTCQDRKDIRHDTKDARKDRRDIRKDSKDRRSDVRDYRDDKRDGASQAELRSDRRDIRKDTRDVNKDRRDLHKDRRDRRADFRDLRHDRHGR